MHLLGTRSATQAGALIWNPTGDPLLSLQDNAQPTKPCRIGRCVFFFSNPSMKKEPSVRFLGGECSHGGPVRPNRSTFTVFLPCAMHAHVFVRIIHGIIIPMYNVHSYFSLKSLGKKAHIIHGKIGCFSFFNRSCGAAVVQSGFRKLTQQYRKALARQPVFSTSTISQAQGLSLYLTIRLKL